MNGVLGSKNDVDGSLNAVVGHNNDINGSVNKVVGSGNEVKGNFNLAFRDNKNTGLIGGLLSIPGKILGIHWKNL